MDITQEAFAPPQRSSSTLGLSSSEIAGTTPDIGQLYVGGQVLQNAKFLLPLNKLLGQSYINSLTGWQFVSKNYKVGSTIYAALPYRPGYATTPSTSTRLSSRERASPQPLSRRPGTASSHWPSN